MTDTYLVHFNSGRNIKDSNGVKYHKGEIETSCILSLVSLS